MKRNIKIAAVLLCCFFAANPLFAQTDADSLRRQNIEEIKKHYVQMMKAYQSNSIIELAVERYYIVENLNFELLYDSPLYRDYIEYWFGSYQFSTTTKEIYEMQLQADILKVLARLAKQKQIETAGNLAKDLANFNISLAFEKNAVEIVKYMQSIDSEFLNRNPKLSRLMTSTQLLEYKIPPKIVGLENDNLKNCLIVFFDSECDHCQIEMKKIIQNYVPLVQRGIRVISISADTDSANYEKYSAQFLWKDRLCDFKGLDGENFNNYGVLGTPTIFFTDSEGKIVGSFAYFEDVFK